MLKTPVLSDFRTVDLDLRSRIEQAEESPRAAERRFHFPGRPRSGVPRQGSDRSDWGGLAMPDAFRRLMTREVIRR